MGWSWILKLILSFSLLPLSTSEDCTITPHKSITANQTIISSGGNFALGFFTPGNSTNTYLGIWYNTIPIQTVVWVANRESPLPNKSSAVFKLATNGNLMLLNAGSKEIIWSSNVTVGVLNISSPAGVLLDNGNLILRHNKTSILWQSFDYPTDTFLPEMKISLNRKTGRPGRLISWADEEDPRPGIFSIGIDPRGRQFYLWKQNKPYWRSNVYASSLSVASGYNMSQGFASYLTYVVEGDDVFLMYSISDKSIKFRLTLVPSGQAQLQLWETSKWVVLWRMPVAECDFYDHCGPFGSCENNGSLPLCKCLTGFSPRIPKVWAAGNRTGGCVRRKVLSCDGRDDFIRFDRMKLPDHSVSLGNMSVGECKFQCLWNCSCKAYAYANMSGQLTVNCLNWFGDLVDLVHSVGIGQDLYVRLHGSEVDAVGNDEHSKLTHRTRSLIAVAVSIVTIGLIFIIIFGYVLRRKRLRMKENIDGNVTSGVGQNDTELLSFSLRSILAATDNFSEENKLGEGGFGPVYKGYLYENQEGAIKRLSKKSLQGLEEFTNELKLIAKLQHKNLVRLLGCCVEGDEMMLMYEYMPNRSLDKFLFDPSGQVNLDWSKRCRIIEGIAQGLLYLHKYSRLKVIHRDLKASNILLDQAMTPKISDFGMARIFGINQTEANTNRVVGTYGYMSPEYALYGQFSEKSDVFSFGVLLLEIVSGKKNTDFHRTGLSLTLLGWAWENWKDGRASESIDPSIRDNCQIHEVVKCINVGLLCVQEIPTDRPSMSDVVVMLSNETALVPSPKEPAFSTRRGSTTTGFSSPTPTSYSNNEVTISIIEPR